MKRWQCLIHKSTFAIIIWSIMKSVQIWYFLFVNRPYLHGVSFEITLTVPLRWILTVMVFYRSVNSNTNFSNHSLSEWKELFSGKKAKVVIVDSIHHSCLSGQIGVYQTLLLYIFTFINPFNLVSHSLWVTLYLFCFLSRSILIFL